MLPSPGMEEDEALIQLAREAFDKHDINQSGSIDQKVGTVQCAVTSAHWHY